MNVKVIFLLGMVINFDIVFVIELMRENIIILLYIIGNKFWYVMLFIYGLLKYVNK